MTETKVKPVKLLMRHFLWQIVFRRANRAGWEKYYERLAKPAKERTDSDKLFIKQFRLQSKKIEYTVVVTHRFSGIKHRLIVSKLDKATRQDVMHKMLQMIKEHRKKTLIVQKETRSFDGARYTRIGGVMETPNSINGLAKMLTTNDPMKTKTPRAKNKNYLGIELEFNEENPKNYRLHDIAAKLQEQGLARYVHVGTDMSCGFEVRVLLEEDGFEVPLKKIMDVLVSMGFKADRNCGTHVHLDMRSRNVKEVYKNMVKTQGFLRKFLTPSRKKNKFCKPNTSFDFDEQLDIQNDSDDRYFGINTQSYGRHGTLEVRMHQGTLDSNVLIPYIKLLTKVINFKGEIKGSVNTLRQAKNQYEIDEELNAQLTQRINTLFDRVLGIGA